VAPQEGNAYLRAMIGNFNAEAGDIIFEFITQHTVKLFGFQVYANNEQKRLRFHMQINGSGNFYITDPQACPPVILSLEAALSEAIITYGKSIKRTGEELSPILPAATEAE
jgi:hypothetical protein